MPEVTNKILKEPLINKDPFKSSYGLEIKKGFIDNNKDLMNFAQGRVDTIFFPKEIASIIVEYIGEKELNRSYNNYFHLSDKLLTISIQQYLWSLRCLDNTLLKSDCDILKVIGCPCTLSVITISSIVSIALLTAMPCTLIADCCIMAKDTYADRNTLDIFPAAPTYQSMSND